MIRFGSVIGACVAILAAAGVSAQTVSPENAAPAESDTGGDIIVTGSRIDRNFQTPTPTITVTAEDLSVGARPNVAAALNDLPQFRATTSAQTTGTNTGAGNAPVDLRGLGINRTLVLIDGRRIVSDNDLNTIPNVLVRSAQVVTGGASAAWGSGAVAGVVNLGIDETFKGLQLGAEAGVSTYGDAAQHRFEGKAGIGFNDDRGHVVIGGEYFNSDGIVPKTARKNIGRWASFAGAMTPDVGFSTSAYGGLITSGVLAGKAFNPDGSLRNFDYGRVSGGYMSGGEGPSNDDLSPLMTPQRRYSALGRFTYEFSPAIKLTAEVRHSRMWNNYIWFGDHVQGSATSGILIKSDNAFLSKSVTDALAAAGQSSFYMGRFNSDLSYPRIDFERKVTQGTLALDGRIGSNLRWSAYYSHGEYQNNIDTPGFLLTKEFANAVDSVIDPASGRAVCRIALTNPSTNCVPINLFGLGAPSKEAIAYVTGTPSQRATTKLDVGGISLRGEPFALPAGKVSFAVGVEARKESIRQTVGALDAAKAFRTFSFSAMSGSFDVKEAFGEILVPLVHNTPLLRQLEFNGAVRVSDYSTTGSIWSWKLGATNEFFPGFRGRVTRSRDIRSANLSELYTQTTTGYNTIYDPLTKQNVYVLSNGGGNPSLEPEKADTWTFGFTYSPQAVRGLNISVDYFDIDVKDVITTIAAQDLVTRCYNGNTALCSRVERDPATNTITRTVSTYVNLANYKTNGIDAEISYVMAMDRLFKSANGRLKFRLIGTWVDSLTTDDGVVKLEYVRSQGYSFGLGVPAWRVNGSVGYENDTFSGLVRARYISPGVFNNQIALSNNHIGAYTYFDLQAQVKVPTGSRSFELYGNVSNLFNKQAPNGSLYSPYYDVLGRYFTFGARVRF
ncbi:MULTISPECIES: TonB-dependent receptor [unclassified Sphingomonas]|uniref:TonB-dependent receptor domain-containing protein n=1 Tax=unclassified Sphingomonas TaxID=196159 RepID=UPI000927DADC|nr:MULTISPECIES: TonB-dependent receptor [unclassified Sphingomonas]OJU20195.1 MAG: outer membrane receptor protein [Sphingomonas sp. 66-10]